MLITTTVDVDASEFDTDDLIKELESRVDGNQPDWNDLYQLLTTGRNEEALARLRLLVQEKTGRIIP